MNQRGFKLMHVYRYINLFQWMVVGNKLKKGLIKQSNEKRGTDFQTVIYNNDFYNKVISSNDV